MAEVFGHRWVSSFGDEPNQSWIDGLADMTPEDLRFGLSALKGWRDEWPPNLLQFRALCRPTIEDAHRIYRPALPEPPEAKAARTASGLHHLAALKGKLR
jgi:hypothetical protein